MRKIRFVGIDPSTNCGLTVLDSKGNVIEAIDIDSPLIAGQHETLRAMVLAKRIRKHLDPSTDKVMIEGYSYGSRGSGVSLQYAFGNAIRAMLITEKIRFLDIAPTQLKKFATGNGTTKKENLYLPVYKKWGFETNNNNILDSYILARIGFSMYNHEDLTEYQKEILKKLEKI